MPPLAKSPHTYSQHGEDLRVAELFDSMGVTSGTCVEFGASDGIQFSNSLLFLLSGWKGLMIEPDPSRYRELKKNLSHLPRVMCTNDTVGLDPPRDLGSILLANGVPSDFELLSIDVDGAEYHIWESLITHAPQVVVIEFNPTFPNEVTFVQERSLRVRKGASPRALVQLGNRKGYEPVASTAVNLIFARNDVFDELGLERNSLHNLRTDTQYVTYLVQFYDGTLASYGCDQMLWHDTTITDVDLQILPALLRVHPEERGPLRRLVHRVWRNWRALRRIAAGNKT
jgi:hypothetical protein